MYFQDDYTLSSNLPLPLDSCRVLSFDKNLNSEFYKELDKYTPRFFEIFNTKGGSVGRKLKKYLQQVTSEVGFSDIK